MQQGRTKRKKEGKLHHKKRKGQEGGEKKYDSTNTNREACQSCQPKVLLFLAETSPKPQTALSCSPSLLIDNLIWKQSATTAPAEEMAGIRWKGMHLSRPYLGEKWPEQNLQIYVFCGH